MAERLKGAFSTRTESVVGFGATKRKIKSSVYVYAEEQGDGTFQVRELNKNSIPQGESKVISREQLLQEYLPEPDMYINKVQPMLRQIEESMHRADAHRDKGELMSAEFEYKNVLRLDEQHIRSTFGLGLTYLERGEQESADLVFRRLVSLAAAFESEHKHLFNEFGIKLRKNKMYAQALRYYFKAYRLEKEDEHLLYNIAKIYYLKRKPRLAQRFLGMALEINPSFSKGKEFRELIEKNQERGGDLPELDTAALSLD